MYKLIYSYQGLGGVWHEDVENYAWPLPQALAYVSWLLERPTARILPGYTVTVVEVEA